jgi:hypothetical protein
MTCRTKISDPLCLAYIAIGAHEAWRTDENAADKWDRGQDGYIEAVIEHAHEVSAAWETVAGNWGGGVWYYDVSEPFGNACGAALLNGEKFNSAEFIAGLVKDAQA